MTCPKCHGEMRVYERSGVTVDQCTECRGIFLDRGELERGPVQVAAGEGHVGGQLAQVHPVAGRRVLVECLLDDRERLVLSLRYGLAGEQPLTLKEIGERLGVTREWVRKI